MLIAVYKRYKSYRKNVNYMIRVVEAFITIKHVDLD
jgi:hypothetical protein